MSRILLVLGGLAFLSSALVYPIAGILASGAVEAYLISAKDPSAVKVEQEIFEAPKGVSKDSKVYRDAVMGIYGSVTDEPTKVLFVPAEKFVRPKELPTLTLLPIDKQKGENPLQVKTVYFFASKTTGGAAAFGALFALAALFTRKKKAPPAHPAAEDHRRYTGRTDALARRPHPAPDDTGPSSRPAPRDQERDGRRRARPQP